MQECILIVNFLISLPKHMGQMPYYDALCLDSAMFAETKMIFGERLNAILFGV